MIPRPVARVFLVIGAIAVLVGAASGLGQLIGVVPVRGSVPTAAVAAVAGLALLVAAQRLLGSPAERPPLSTRAPEQVEPVPVLGASLDGAIDRGDGATVRDRLSELAADRLETRTAADAEETATALASGTWTDDALAAAAITQSTTATPLSHRLYRRLFPRRGLERQTRRTLAAIEAIDAGTIERSPEGQQSSGQSESSKEPSPASASRQHTGAPPASPASADSQHTGAPSTDPASADPQHTGAPPTDPASADQPEGTTITDDSTATAGTASGSDSGVQSEDRPPVSQEGTGK